MEKLRKYVFLLLGLVVAIVVAFNMWEENDSGDILVIQGVGGNLKVVYDPGPALQLFGTVTRYKRSSQFYFLGSSVAGSDGEDSSLKIRFNDGGHAQLSGSMRYELPLDPAKMLKVHKAYRSQDAIDRQLIFTTISKSVYMTGPLMSSKESSAEKRNDMISYIEDQAGQGIYRTRQINVIEKDPLSGVDKNVTKVEIVKSTAGIPIRQEASTLSEYGIRLYNLAINELTYDNNVEKQIQSQQKAIMSVQSAIANAKRAEQDAITTEKQGEADAAKAKWAQEVIKSKLVTQAEADKAVAELAVQTASLNKQKDILEGEGIAAKKRLVMQADGALTQKLATYEKTQKFWADAFQNYGGNLVPTYVSGGGGAGNAGFNFMELMSAKAAKDLGLDLKNK